MGIQRCLDKYDELQIIEIDRAYQLLKDNGQGIKVLKESWQTFSQKQYVFIGRFYSRFTGTDWLYRRVEDDESYEKSM